MNYLDKKADEEVEMRISVQKFLREVIYPKLSDKKKAEVDNLLDKGIAIDGAFSMAGIKYIVN